MSIKHCANPHQHNKKRITYEPKLNTKATSINTEAFNMYIEHNVRYYIHKHK